MASGCKRWLGRGVLALMGLLAGLAIIELTIRVFDLKPQNLQGKTYLRAQSDASALYDCYSSNPNGEFRPVPDVSHGEWQLTSCSVPPTQLPLSELKKTHWCVEDRVSDQGLRDRHYSSTPPAGKIRLAMVGDSFVRGEGVPIDRCLPRQLEALLGADKYEVMNVGFVAFGTEEEVTSAQEIVGKVKVDSILLVFIPNDIRLTTALLDRQELINDLINIRDEHLARHQENKWYQRAPRAVQLIESSLELRQITRDTVQWYLDSYDPAFNAGGLQLLAGNFRRLASLPGCRVAVVIYPLLFELENAYPLAPVHSRVKQMVTEAGLPVLDLAPTFLGANTRSLHVHPSDHHPNGRAHAIAARAIHDWLVREHPDFLSPFSIGQAPIPSAAKTGEVRP
jgi:hypothetical protein